MRKLQIPVITALAVGLLAGSTVGIAAQDDVSMDPALVTGMLDRPHPSALYYFEDIAMEGFTREHNIEDAHVEMSDRRLTGSVIIDSSKDRFESGNHRDTDVGWGTIHVENEAGAWDGRLIETSDISVDGSGVAFIESTGSGAYTGLSAILFDTETSGLVNGIIFPGELPADRGTGSLVPRAD